MKTNIKSIKLMSEEKVSKALLTLSIPIIIGMLVNASYNVIDAYFIGIGAGSYISLLIKLIELHLQQWLAV